MMRKPAYFDSIRENTVSRWAQLESDPELAGPWRQLFNQVQSPRHVLSELLQNADDAGATEAVVRVENQVFTFQHNGQDFTEEHFLSICRFGYSSKRALHTIGFRGIGFKSTFSLGSEVELYTPSLSVKFDRQRFTQPELTEPRFKDDGLTRIRVAIVDSHREKELARNLEEWLESPLSLLFFKSIRRMQVNDHPVEWNTLGPGPIANSEWMALGEKSDRFLVIRSDPEPFPEDALAEIRQERLLGIDENLEFPPCSVEIVLGAEGNLFVVLPTRVKTALPFACNAPFIQDPARLKIKDPETSPTNRWLLDRTGELAASAMLQWLNDSDAPLVVRAEAYDLLPDVDRKDGTVEGVSGTAVEVSFAARIQSLSILLTDAGHLVPSDGCVFVPELLLNIWPEAATLLDTKSRSALCRAVKAANRKKLLNWGFVEEITRQKVLEILESRQLPKPKSWRQLFALWIYIVDGFGHRYFQPPDYKIVPVQGQKMLFSASEIIRLGEKKLLAADADWEFLSKYLLVLNPNWPRYLAEQKRLASEAVSDLKPASVEAVYWILERMRLHEASDVTKVLEKVAAGFFGQSDIYLADCVRFAHIAAKLGRNPGTNFQFVTRDNFRRLADFPVLFDENGELEELLPETKRESHLLHSDYVSNFESCTQDEWRKWIRSGQCGLHTFILPVSVQRSIYGRRSVTDEALRRGVDSAQIHFNYVTHDFILEDWDFEEVYWRHWMSASSDDPWIWAKLVRRLLEQRESYWSKARGARLAQVATTGSRQSITQMAPLPSWSLRLREVACLKDTRGFLRNPTDLLRRTPATEPFLDVESFVDVTLDTEKHRKFFDLIGVRNVPPSPDSFLNRLRALAKSEKPPMHEVEKMYRKLDQMIATCSTQDFAILKGAFRNEKLIMAEDGEWCGAGSVFLSSDLHSIPDLALVHESVSDLSIWRKMGVADRPTPELALAWLKTIPSCSVLSEDEARRVRSLLARFALSVWIDCGHWLTLMDTWMPVGSLSFCVTAQTLVEHRHLHPAVRQKTADLLRLSVEITGSTPFNQLTPLAHKIEERLDAGASQVPRLIRKNWLESIGLALCRATFETSGETERIRENARRLAETAWCETPDMVIIPYLDGTPAGIPRPVDVAWLGTQLHVRPMSRPKLARRVPEEIARAFGRAEIRAALDYGFERSASEIDEYLEENFELDEPVAEVSQTKSQDSVDGGRHGRPDLIIADDQQADLLENNSEEGHTESEGGSPIEKRRVSMARSHNPLQSPKPKQSLIERFAKACGFRKDGENRFVNQVGDRLARSEEARFPWERRRSDGEIVRFYWPEEHCLDRAPLQLEADIWGLLQGESDRYALILTDSMGAPVELTGTILRTMCNQRELVLYPATYRLVRGS